MEDCGLKAMTHYEFFKKIALDWISGGKHFPDYDLTDDVSTASSLSHTDLSRSTSGMLRPRITNAALHPITGCLRGRLNHAVGYYPVQAKDNNSYKRRINKSCFIQLLLIFQTLF